MGTVKAALRRLAVVIALVLAATIGAIVAATGLREPVSGKFVADPSPPSATASPGAPDTMDARAPDPVAPAFTPRDTRPLSRRSYGWRWAPVLREVVARTKPRARAPRVMRLRTRTPEGTQNIVAVGSRAAPRAAGPGPRLGPSRDARRIRVRADAADR
jgi:hypothetical protein